MKNAIVPSTLTTIKESKKEKQPFFLKRIINSLKYRSLLEVICQSVLHFAARSREPKIRQKCDRRGNTYWVAYDPATNCTATFSSEQEVRIWLDERYYL